MMQKFFEYRQYDKKVYNKSHQMNVLVCENFCIMMQKFFEYSYETGNQARQISAGTY